MYFIFGQLVTGAGNYAAIRADLREALVHSQAAIKAADEAHQRIDKLLERGAAK